MRERGNEGRGGTYAGSRPASGLSKNRRSAFRGPPPSYFREGGGGGGGAQSSSTAGTGQGQENGQWEGTYGPASPFAQANDFDSSGVYKTQTHEDERRDRRREAAAQAAINEMEQEADFWVRFVIVTVIVVGGVSVGTLVVGMWDRPGGGVGGGGGLVRGDGSLRKINHSGLKNRNGEKR